MYHKVMQDMRIEVKYALNKEEHDALQNLEDTAKIFENIEFSFPREDEDVLYLLGFYNDILISALSFYLIDAENALFHCIGATLPRYRKRGCFKQLYQTGISHLQAQYMLPLQIEFLLDTACISGKNALVHMGAEILYTEILMDKSLEVADIAKIKDRISEYSLDIEYDDEEDIYIIYADDEHIGEFRFIENGESIYFFAFQIYDEFQNHGYGKSSFAYILKYIYESGYSHILLEVRGDNAKAIHIYESFEFQIMTKIEAYHLTNHLS